MSRTSSALIFFAVLAAATLAVYLPTLGNELVFDDKRLSDGTIFGVFGNLLQFRPRMLSYGSFVWVKALLGDEWWKQRLVNVFLHLGVCWSLFVLFTQLLNSGRFAEENQADPELLPSKQAAVRVGVILFAVNPVAVYAVAYLVQRSIVMASLFVVLACIAWVRGLQTGKYGWMALALLSYVLAVMSKESAVTAAALAAPLYVFVLRPPMKRVALISVLALLPVLVVAGFLLKSYGSIIGTVFDETSRLFVQQLERLSPGVSARVFPLSILNQAALFFYYGLLWFLPNVQWMSIDLRPAFPLSFATFPQTLGAIGFLALLVGAAWLLLRRSALLGFLGLCLLFPALLFLSEFATVWLQDPFVLYRSYLWAIALPGLVAIPLIGLKPKVIYPVGVVLAVLFTSLALERTFTFKSNQTVWSDAVEKLDLRAKANAVGRWRPFINRGAYYLDRELADYAIEDFARAETLGETFGSARFNMGMSQHLVKKYDDALVSFAKAEAQGFKDPALYFQRAETLQALGKYAEAYASYSTALERRPTPELASQIRLRRAGTAVLTRNYDAAITDYNLLLALKPGDPQLMMRLGMAYVGKDDSQKALGVFNSMLAAKPTAAGYYGRGLAYVVGQEKEKGLKDLEQAVALEPRNSVYQNTRNRIAAGK